MTHWMLLSRVARIIILDLVLSGDNAVVIGMAARTLPPVQRRRAIVVGGGAAIALRIILAALASLLLRVALLQAIGGLLLVWIAVKLVRPGSAAAHVQDATSFPDAIRTIVLADAVMSLDNILAVGGAAHGNLWLLLFGLALSIPLILIGANVVARLLNRLPWLIWIGTAILAWTAGQMMTEDPIVRPYTDRVPGVHAALPAVVVLLVLLATGWLRYGIQGRADEQLGLDVEA